MGIFTSHLSRKPQKAAYFLLLTLLFASAQIAFGAMRGRPFLNAARTTFVADNGQLLRGPYTSSE